MKTPRTDSIACDISQYFTDLKTGNRPQIQRMVVPASFARKLEIEIRKLKNLLKPVDMNDMVEV